MNFILRLLSTAILVLVIDYFMKDITVANFTTSIIVALVLGLLNIFLKPILVLFTLPVTIVTLGLFLLVINGAIILLCDYLVDGFAVKSFVTALIFSVVLSVSQSIINRILKD
jgi:putative membrane protein